MVPVTTPNASVITTVAIPISILNTLISIVEAEAAITSVKVMLRSPRHYTLSQDSFNTVKSNRVIFTRTKTSKVYACGCNI